MKKNFSRSAIPGDLLGGLTAMLVALPSAIAYGLIIFAPLGNQFTARGAVAGMIGAVVTGIIAPIFGGTPRLVSAPSAPAAVVLSAFVLALASNGGVDASQIPFLIILVAVLSGLCQLILGAAGGGRFIKYIPYPVVSGYLSGVGLLIIIGQFPRLFGVGGGALIRQLPDAFDLIQWKGLFVGLAAMAAMLAASRWKSRVPAPIIALTGAVAVYWVLASRFPEMTSLAGNAMLVGPIAGGENLLRLALEPWSDIPGFDLALAWKVAVTVGTLSIILSIDTLKTCVILDAMTRSRHDSNRELRGQGLANLLSALVSGMPGAGTIGPTLVNLGSGAKSRLSGVFAGVFSLLALLCISPLIAWLPLAALAGILFVIGARLIDFRSLILLRHRSTLFDFAVSLIVVLSAVFFNLIAAAGAGILLSILIFVRDQVRQSVVRRKAHGNQISSKKRRLPNERDLLTRRGNEILAVELQGPLFFGTADQLMTELEGHLANCRYIILDMRRVQTLDYTAVHRLDQLEQQVRENGGVLIITSLPRNLPSGLNIQNYLKWLGLIETGRCIRFFADLDEGIEWAEERVLDSEKAGCGDGGRILDLGEINVLSTLPASAIRKLRSSVVEKTFAPGGNVFSRGDRGNEIFFIRKGTVHIYLPLAGGMRERLITFGQGDFFGDMSFLTGDDRSADAIAGEEAHLFIMSRDSFDRLSRRHPEMGEIVFERIAIALAQRLRQTDIMLKTLAEN